MSFCLIKKISHALQTPIVLRVWLVTTHLLVNKQIPAGEINTNFVWTKRYVPMVSGAIHFNDATV